MSFSAVASCSDDKGSNHFGRGYEELGNDFFDQFLSFNDNETVDWTTLPQSTYLKDDGNSTGTSLGLTDDGVKQHSLWRGELGASSSNPASAQTSQFYAEPSGRAAMSDSELLSLKGIDLYSPQIPAHPRLSLPSSPSPAAASPSRRTCITESFSKSLKKSISSFDKALLRSPIRKPNHSPKMMRASHQSRNNLDALGQKLQQDISEFNLEFHENSRNLTPLLARRHFNGSANSNTAPAKINKAFANNGTMLYRSAGAVAYSTPIATPILDKQYSQIKSSQHPSPSGPLFPITPQDQNASGSWSQLPGSPPLNTFGASTVYPDLEQPLWWNHAATTKMAQPVPSGFHTNPRRATKSLAIQLQNGLAYDTNELSFNPSAMTSGLMIQMPSDHQQSFAMGSPPMQQQGYFEAIRPQPQRRAAHRQYAPAPSRQPPFNSSIRKNRSGSSESESSSPKSPSSSAFRVRKRRSLKTNKHSTMRTPTLRGAVDFVNFTPSDSEKILTGVAPSGSSKTKARREKEAMEKRRKLSQAAVRAVTAAGGDIESLVEEGLFV